MREHDKSLFFVLAHEAFHLARPGCPCSREEELAADLVAVQVASLAFGEYQHDVRFGGAPRLLLQGFIGRRAHEVFVDVYSGLGFRELLEGNACHFGLNEREEAMRSYYTGVSSELRAEYWSSIRQVLEQ